jgi:integrase
MSTPNHFEFTRPRVDGATCPDEKQQVFFWDTRQPGLGLRVTSNGRRTFIFEAKLGRQTIRMTIGPASMPIRVPKDRKGNPTGPGADGEALRLMSLIKAGTDPRAEKAATMARESADRDTAKVERQRQQVTGLDAWAAYGTARAAHWGALSQRDHASAVQAGGEPRARSKALTTQPGPLRALLAHPLALVDTDKVEAWLKVETANRPTVAARNFRLLRGFLRWCGEHPEFGAIAQAEAHKPRRVRELVPSVGTKDDCLQREQLPLWFDAVRDLSNPVPAAFLQVALLTGARREELAGMRWQAVDFRWQSLTLADKVEGERIIPLTPYVSRLLAALPRRNEWVFSSPTAADGRIQDPREAHERALATAGLPHLTIHGLRRSFGTLCEWVEMPAGVVAQIQGHKPSATAEKHYRRRPLDLLRMWHTRAEAWILEQAGMKQPSASKEPAPLRVVSQK